MSALHSVLALFGSGVLLRGKDFLRSLNMWYELNFQITIMEPWEKVLTHCFVLLTLYLSSWLIRVLFNGFVVLTLSVVEFNQTMPYWSLEDTT